LAQYNPEISQIKLAADSKIKRVVICSGKVYYDLFEEREKNGRNDVYLLRLEQFYPYPDDAMQEELKRFKNAEMVWCQEEPKNMGAWTFIDPFIEESLIAIGARNIKKNSKLSLMAPLRSEDCAIFICCALYGLYTLDFAE